MNSKTFQTCPSKKRNFAFLSTLRSSQGATPTTCAVTPTHEDRFCYVLATSKVLNSKSYLFWSYGYNRFVEVFTHPLKTEKFRKYLRRKSLKESRSREKVEKFKPRKSYYESELQNQQKYRTDRSYINEILEQILNGQNTKPTKY